MLFAYAVKWTPVISSWEPDIWDLLDKVRDNLANYSAELLPIHEHYSINLRLPITAIIIYDFALPMVTLYALYSSKVERLAKWFRSDDGFDTRHP